MPTGLLGHRAARACSTLACRAARSASFARRWNSACLAALAAAARTERWRSISIAPMPARQTMIATAKAAAGCARKRTLTRTATKITMSSQRLAWTRDPGTHQCLPLSPIPESLRAQLESERAGAGHRAICGCSRSGGWPLSLRSASTDCPVHVAGHRHQQLAPVLAAEVKHRDQYHLRDARSGRSQIGAAPRRPRLRSTRRLKQPSRRKSFGTIGLHAA